MFYKISFIRSSTVCEVNGSIRQQHWARKVFNHITMAMTKRCSLVGVTGIITMIGLIHVYQYLNATASYKFRSTKDTASNLIYTNREFNDENMSSSDTFRASYHLNPQTRNKYSLELPDCPKVYMSYKVFHYVYPYLRSFVPEAGIKSRNK